MLRWVGLCLVCLGCAFLATDGTRWDFKVVSWPGPGQHGLHAFEALGIALVVAGVAALWMTPLRRR